MAAAVDEVVAARRYEGVGAIEEERFEPDPAPDVVPCAAEGRAPNAKGSAFPPNCFDGQAPAPSASNAKEGAFPSGGSRAAHSTRSSRGRAAMVRFRSLYESRDGRLCLYEDERGHLQAVDTSKLA